MADRQLGCRRYDGFRWHPLHAGGHKWLLIIGTIAVLARWRCGGATSSARRHFRVSTRPSCSSGCVRHGAVHRLRGDVLRGVFLGLFRVEPVPGGRRLAAQDHPSVRPLEFPFLNTLILLLSGTTVTWAHHALIEGDRRGLMQRIDADRVSRALCFTSVRAWEYSPAPFHFAGGIYPSTFFMATGFHGFHVIIGTIFLVVCLCRGVALAISSPTITSGSRRLRGIGISSTSCGCSCSFASTGGVRARRCRPSIEG